VVLVAESDYIERGNRIVPVVLGWVRLRFIDGFEGCLVEYACKRILLEDVIEFVQVGDVQLVEFELCMQNVVEIGETLKGRV